jgi:hypothetical protein
MMEPTPEMFHSILDTFKSMMDTQRRAGIAEG